MLNSDYTKAEALASGCLCLSMFVDICLMEDGDPYVERSIKTLDSHWPVVAADPDVLAWYRAGMEFISGQVDPNNQSAAPGSAARRLAAQVL